MRWYTSYLTFNTKQHREYIRITDKIASIVHESAIQEGMALISAMHITAGVWVNDNEQGIIADIDEMLGRLAPEGIDYRHHRTGEINGDAHLKNILVHHQVTVPITNGDLDLGPWQQIFYCEFDGQRNKRLIVKLFGETNPDDVIIK